MSRKEALSQFIQQIHGRPVVVKLNSGVDYRGKVVKMFTSSLLSWVLEVLCSLQAVTVGKGLGGTDITFEIVLKRDC
jgi:hypothetical protein